MLLIAIGFLLTGWVLFLVNWVRFRSLVRVAGCMFAAPAVFYFAGMAAASANSSEGYAYGVAFLTIVLALNGLVMGAVTLGIHLLRNRNAAEKM
ncbi:hypothetical protein [Alteribacter natronophilus]|uniref:hypothetical protein n=1 Tax=Alteribacter natronophilus TaxID=2583810 RepID=UPI00110D6658|nr:hypothetical protein [Alteribacter natronophilus]TMW72759.1 hypothetical protein FGB90_00145 [Alteribacter natronophilus]